MICYIIDINCLGIIIFSNLMLCFLLSDIIVCINIKVVVDISFYYKIIFNIIMIFVVDMCVLCIIVKFIYFCGIIEFVIVFNLIFIDYCMIFCCKEIYIFRCF